MSSQAGGYHGDGYHALGEHVTYYEAIVMMLFVSSIASMVGLNVLQLMSDNAAGLYDKGWLAG